MHRLLRKQQKNDISNSDIKRFVKGRLCGDEKHLGAVIVAKQAFRELYRNVTDIKGKWKIRRTKTFIYVNLFMQVHKQIHAISVFSTEKRIKQQQ